MPILLLAQGDPAAKDLLRRSIEARYALSPPVIDNVKISFTGRVQAKVGPVITWVPVQIATHFRFPSAIRWDFSVRPVGVPVQRGIESYDGRSYRRLRGKKISEVTQDLAIINSLQRRLWAMAAVLLTPLSEHFVQLKANDSHSFDATNKLSNDTVTMYLRPNYTLEQVAVHCLNPDNGQQQWFSLYLSEEQTPVDDIMLPCQIHAFWDDKPYYEVQPVAIENSSSINDAVFALTAEV
jgi:hypothetical protein